MTGVMVRIWGYDETDSPIKGLQPGELTLARMPVIGDRLNIGREIFLVTRTEIHVLDGNQTVAGEVDVRRELAAPIAPPEPEPGAQ